MAKHAGVSVATVSRVLNGSDPVDPAKAETVRRALATLNYRRDGMATGLRRRRNNIVGVVIPDVANPFYTEVVRGIEDYARSRGFLVALCNSYDDFNNQEQALELLLVQRVSAVIIAPSSVVSERLKELMEDEVAVVMVDRQIPGMHADSVTIDNIRGAERIMARLIDDGHRRIAHITGPMSTTTASERVIGYKRALRTAGLPFAPELLHVDTYDEAGGANGMRALLAHNPPDAVFAANNLIAIGALQTLHQQGVAPEDVVVASFDALPWASDPQRQVIYFEHPTYELGSIAAEYALSRVADLSIAPRQITLSAGEVR